MKVLLSAYACEPHRGSESEVGWQWAIGLAAMGHQTWVLTRANNRPPIEQALDGETPAGLRFLYYDLPAWARRWKRGGRGVHLYYLLWQLGAYRLARRVHAVENFDLVHHVTFVSARQPSFMGSLGIPFFFGPVAGGERAPWRLRWGYGWRGWLRDALRDVLNQMIRIDPLMRNTFRQATRIYATSEQTRRLVPRRYREKTTVCLAVGLGSANRAGAADETARGSAGAAGDGAYRLIFVGQFLDLKGMHLGLRAVARATGDCPDLRITMVGGGPQEGRWRRLADRLGIAERIDWIPWTDQPTLDRIYRAHDVLLFPSLHDSGGMVVLEALSRGLPVVCLGIGGPAVIVDETCGRTIGVDGAGERDVIEALMAAIIELHDVDVRSRLGCAARRRVSAFCWPRKLAGIYGDDASPLDSDAADVL